MSNKVNSFQVGGDTYGIIPDLTFDNYPTEGSSNPVTSDGIARAVQGAAVGTDISVGREPGTPIGYCSIAYGDKNIASSDYSIVFGVGNKCISDTSILCGRGCASFFGYGNMAEGYDCIATGYGNIANGLMCYIGGRIKDTTLESTDLTNAEIYSGYFNLANNKLYYDPEMQVERPIVLPTVDPQDPNMSYGITYIVDLTSDTGRTPGTIYEYARGKTNRVITVTANIVYDRWVWFTDYCRNSLYFYKGACYYDAANDKNYRHYSDGSFSDEITSSNASVGYVYFDLLSSDFVLYCANIGEYPYSSSHPKWLKVKVYRYPINSHYYGGSSGYSNRYQYMEFRYGRFAYVYTDRNQDETKYGRVYSSSDYAETSDITDQLLDGEIVVDLSTHGNGNISQYCAFKYRFNINHTLAYMCTYSDCGWSFAIGRGCSVLGDGNKVTGGTSIGTIVGGRNNVVQCGNSAVAMFGKGNSVKVGRTDGGSGGDEVAFSIVGVGNSVDTRSTHCHTGYLFGEGNGVTGTGQIDHLFLQGYSNALSGEEMGRGAYISGTSNTADSINDSHITGRNNQVYFEGEAIVDGSFNHVGFLSSRSYNSGTDAYTITNYSVVNIHINKHGIYEGTGVTYDATNHTYTFDTNKIYKVYGIPDNLSRYEDQTSDSLIFVGYSLDGHTINGISPNTDNTEYNAITVNGFQNSYIRRLESNWYQYSNQHNFIIGSNNIMYAYGNNGIIMIGKGLMYFKDGPSGLDVSGPMGAIYMGTYNALNSYYDGGYDGNDCTVGAKFVLGIGTGPNDRRNGFVVNDNGIAGLPSAPDKISEARINWNPNKMLITYGMLQDYAPRTPGAVGKPAVAIVTLAANNWEGLDQDVVLTDMTAGAVVIAQANGNPYAYNQHSIYLSAQTDHHLTFTCATLPSVDVSVKVVYWT